MFELDIRRIFECTNCWEGIICEILTSSQKYTCLAIFPSNPTVVSLYIQRVMLLSAHFRSFQFNNGSQI